MLELVNTVINVSSAHKEGGEASRQVSKKDKEGSCIRDELSTNLLLEGKVCSTVTSVQRVFRL